MPAPRHAPPPAPQRGLTLVELVTMLLVVAVLAAVALPRYADVQLKAREAKVKAAAGAIQAVAALARSNAEARRIDCDDAREAHIDIDGQRLALMHCYPRAVASFAEGILAAARLEPDGWVVAERRDGGSAAVVIEAADALTPAACAVSYTLPRRGSDGAVVALQTGGC